MSNEVRAIDFMYYVATPEFIHRWNTAKTGELICRMERAIGGLPKYESIEAMIAKMDEAEVEKEIFAQVIWCSLTISTSSASPQAMWR